MDPDDQEYRKSVRNMTLVLAAIVITAFAGIFIPPYLSQPHNQYLTSVSAPSSTQGITIHLGENSTAITPSGSLLITGWVNSTSAGIEDINASDAWALPPSQLWGSCNVGWPIGIGIMFGHYTAANFSTGTLITPSPILSPCGLPPHGDTIPIDFVIRPQSSQALVTVNGTPTAWNLLSSLNFHGTPQANQLTQGVYTAVIADEWGDVLTMIFQVT